MGGNSFVQHSVSLQFKLSLYQTTFIARLLTDQLGNPQQSLNPPQKYTNSR